VAQVLVVDHDPEQHREQGVDRGDGGQARCERAGLEESWLSGLVALGEAEAGEISAPRVGQIAGASSSKAATTRTVTGSSTPSS
jgi:hypothetical protein